jgi:Uma2 family endonuclease
MSTAPRYIPHYTVDDYRHWKGDWELLDGVPISMSPSPFGRHERITSRTGHAFLSAFDSQGCDCEVYYNLDWIIGDDTVVRPDVMVVCGIQPDRHLDRAPEVAVEVLSPSTREFDQTTKRKLYREQGVGFYLIVDPDENQIEIIRIQSGTEIASETISGDGRWTLDLQNGCHVELIAKDLLHDRYA